MKKVLEKSYEPSKVEEKWYNYWVERGLFSADLQSKEKTFSMVIPPPNVTGSLHMGHALNCTLQDVIARYKKMKGYNVLWVPGTDHAGIATQNVVERELAQRGIARQELGREEFIKEVWRWKENYGNRIINQLKRLGCSCDWRYQRFTMDEGFSKAVKEVFVHLYKEGLIFQGDYIINWCPRCQTALADLEVEYEPHKGNLYYIRYLREDKRGYITVATTRPETLLGDTAVAVHPEDERYKNLKGVYVLVPILNRPIPIIFDTYVEREFGTGALKVTPAHDPNDFEIGSRHNLPAIKVIDEKGEMTDEAGPYKGLDRFVCRERIVDDLKEEGLLEKIEPLEHSVGHCYRCKTIVEPLLSKQWFVRTKPLAQAAIAAVKEKRTRLIPSNWEKVYFEWLYNIRDWCISRQIWWGHRIPAWYCKDCGNIIVDKERPVICQKCGGKEFREETDVLDTWFSSALWPFGTLGWPENTNELKMFYPTSVLITGFDILFFWVARMMMMGLHFMHEVPFHDVYIHALIRDEKGQKMSKSKGNVIDPLVMTEKYGTDALRFTLVSLAVQGRDIQLSEKYIKGYRHFVNKLWNAARFTLLNIEDYIEPMPERGSVADRWIITQLQDMIKSVNNSLEAYEFDKAAYALYHFIWYEFCDWYLEWIKPTLYQSRDLEEKRITQGVLLETLSTILRLLHPFMPFVTEEIWHHLPGEKKSILESSYPTYRPELRDESAKEEMELMIGLVKTIRNMRGEINIPPSTKIKIILSGNKDLLDKIAKHKSPIAHLGVIGELLLTPKAQRPICSSASLWQDVEIFMPLKGIIDLEAEERRLDKEIGKIVKELSIHQRKLANEDFLSKAPKAVVEKEREKTKALDEKLIRLRTNLDKVRSIIKSKEEKNGSRCSN